MEAGFKNEENTRKLVQKEMAVMKEEVKTFTMGSNCTASSEASTRVGLGSGTFARPPPLATRWADPWAPRKLEFKGWNPDYTLKPFWMTLRR